MNPRNDHNVKSTVNDLLVANTLRRKTSHTQLAGPDRLTMSLTNHPKNAG
jgi:hypothetical protein